MIYINDKTDKFAIEQISLILGNNFVITFQEKEGDVFDSIRERIRKVKGKIRKLGPDYLAYSLLDSIIDNYFVVLENFGEKIELIEANLLSNPDQQLLHTIHSLKNMLIELFPNYKDTVEKYSISSF